MDLEALLINAKDPDSFHLPQGLPTQDRPEQQNRVHLGASRTWAHLPEVQGTGSHHMKLNYTLGLQAPHEYFFPLPACCSQGSSTKPRPLVACGKQAHIASFFPDTGHHLDHTVPEGNYSLQGPWLQRSCLSPQFPSMAKNG